MSFVFEDSNGEKLTDIFGKHEITLGEGEDGSGYDGTSYLYFNDLPAGEYTFWQIDNGNEVKHTGSMPFNVIGYARHQKMGVKHDEHHH